MNFKIGEEVMISHNLSHTMDKCGLNEEMRIMKGKTYRINDIDLKNQTCRIFNSLTDNAWNFSLNDIIKIVPPGNPPSTLFYFDLKRL